MFVLRSILLFVLFILSVGLKGQCPTLIWNDEFDGTSVNMDNWSFQIGDGCDLGQFLCGWGNNELQWYTANNAEVSDGTLKIIARRESISGSSYSSARLRTKNKGDFKYGRIEARMKLPIGQGIWPAFWLLSTNELYGGWPQSGEIDIMELLGHEPSTVHGTIHFGQPWPNNAQSTAKFDLAEDSFNDDFHDMAIEWTANDIKWYVDGYLYSTKRRSDLGGQRWPFDQNFHILLNMAVGGNWPGNPNGSTVFPQTFEIDYVRVYDMVGQAYLTGSQVVANMQKGVKYGLEDIPVGSTIVWSVPETATIQSGQGSDEILVDWENKGGPIEATITNDCGSYNFSLAVEVEGPFAALSVLENFDMIGRITRVFESGEFFDDVSNPSPNDVNGSQLCGEYRRSSSDQFDILSYSITDISNGAEFVSGDKKILMDIYTNAPIGTEILMQFENSFQSSPTNYPSGRHSRYRVYTTKTNEWERVEFRFVDRPDTGMSNSAINEMILLFAPNTFNASTYYFDNVEIFGQLSTSVDELYYGLEIMPNPVVESLHIRVENDHAITSVKLVDTSGKMLKNETGVRDQNYSLDMAELQPGIYFVAITFSDNQSIIKTIFKQ